MMASPRPGDDLFSHTMNSQDSPIKKSEVLDIGGRMVEKYLNQDSKFPLLTEKMRLDEQVKTSFSGLTDSDYPSSVAFTNIVNVDELKPLNRIPLPSEIIEQFGNLRDFRMGLFPQISRAWLSIDSDIYLWNYETGTDVAYYDGLNEIIISVGLAKPKVDVFQPFVEYLLILTTPSEIIVLGIILGKGGNDAYGDELQLTPDVIYAIPTDSVPITKVYGTNKGRIFLGGRDGCLYEIDYQKEIGWWGKRCKKVNHSKGALSFLMPAFINSALYDEDPLVDIMVDKSRNILFTLSEKGTVEVFDLGHDGWGMSRVASVTPSSLLSSISHIIRLDSIEGGLEIGRVVSLCPLEEGESVQVGCVAVTSRALRLYLSTCNNPRPTSLQLVHVRLPPGYSQPSIQSMRPSSAISAHSLPGSLVISTTLPESAVDKLWCLSGDMYATKNWFSETVTEVQLSGKPLVITQVPSDNESLGKCVPLMVYQHNYVPDKIAVLTTQGTDLYEKLRPVDVLAEVLRRRNGPDSEEVRNLFAVIGHDDACAMAVMLACDHWTTNTQVAEWATRALILYGGEPRAVTQQVPYQVGAPLYSQSSQQASPALPHYPPMPTTLPYPVQTPSIPACFKPREMSTPLGTKPFSLVETQVVQTSHKHNGLYMYLTRIVRPIWFKKVVTRVTMHDGNQYLVSSLFESEIIQMTAQLSALKVFLQKNTHLPPASGFVVRGDGSSPVGGGRSRVAEAIQQERNSLEALRQIVERCLQNLGLWRLLTEHQFHLIVQALPQDYLNQLPELTFKDLVFIGKDLCQALINSLIQMYLSDNTSVDSISNKLREVCPSLFKPEDAACSKANEVLLAAKDEPDPDERQAKLKLALKLCKEVAKEVDMSQVCRQLVQCGHYSGVLELCKERADQHDPNGLAQHYLAKNQPPEDTRGHAAYLARVRTYQEIRALLDLLYQQCFPSSRSPAQLPSNQPSSAHTTLEGMLSECMEVGDEVCHWVVYEWLISRGLNTTAVRLGRPSLERYLTRPHTDQPPKDLLWQYYETTGNHSAAAQVLYTIATQPSEEVKFDQRLIYLGKAVMCMRSEGCGQHLGIFLHELEDLVHVARIQKQILDKLAAMPRDAPVEEAIGKLNSRLLTITELYEEFTVPFNLWESKLAILDCAGHEDKELIEHIWENIISEECSRVSSNNPDDQMALVMNKIKTLGLQYTIKSCCFPLAYLVRELELLSCRLGVSKSIVHSTLVSIGASLISLVEIYDRLLALNDRCWGVEGNELHLVQVIASLADAFVSNPRMVPTSDRKLVAIQLLELITNCLATLYTRPDSSQLCTYIKNIQTNLENALN